MGSNTDALTNAMENLSTRTTSIDLVEDAETEGLVEEEGFADGFPEGFAEGVPEGFAEGFVEGVAEGVVDGLAEGIGLMEPGGSVGATPHTPHS